MSRPRGCRLPGRADADSCRQCGCDDVRGHHPGPGRSVSMSMGGRLFVVAMTAGLLLNHQGLLSTRFEQTASIALEPKRLTIVLLLAGTGLLIGIAAGHRWTHGRFAGAPFAVRLAGDLAIIGITAAAVDCPVSSICRPGPRPQPFAIAPTTGSSPPPPEPAACCSPEETCTWCSCEHAGRLSSTAAGSTGCPMPSRALLKPNGFFATCTGSTSFTRRSKRTASA